MLLYQKHRLELACFFSGLWLVGNEGIDKKMETSIMSFMGAAIRIDPFSPG